MVIPIDHARTYLLRASLWNQRLALRSVHTAYLALVSKDAASVECHGLHVRGALVGFCSLAAEGKAWIKEDFARMRSYQTSYIGGHSSYPLLRES